MDFLTEFLKNAAAELDRRGRNGVFPAKWFTDGTCNKGRRVHAAMWSILVKAITPPFFPMIEMELKFGQERGFRPDITVIDEADRPVAIIEYESTNSSDGRLMVRDVERYAKTCVQPACGLPDWWIVISTLPNCQVKSWPWHPAYQKTQLNREETKQAKARLNQNPLEYYGASIIESCSAAWEKVSNRDLSKTPKLVWVNLTTDAATIMSIQGRESDPPKQFHFQLASN